MPLSKNNCFKISGICCALPKNAVSVEDLGKDFFNINDIKRISQVVGLKKLYISNNEQTSADFCYSAAEKLIANLKWEKESIDCLIFVSQTSDYILPATACILQHRLGLSKNCAAFDVNLGCSGYVYGLWMASEFIKTGTCKRVLVLFGDTISKTVSRMDKSVALLFGDGGSATALEVDQDSSNSTFILKTDGSGAENLIIPAGGFRKRISDRTKIIITDEDGNKRTEENLYMNGAEIFSFTITEVPIILKEIMECHSWEIDDVDYFLFHQANNYMLKYLIKKLKLPSGKVPLNIEKFGNTSGLSIPLLICDQLHEEILDKNLKVIMIGFGVGLSWGAAALNLNKFNCAEIIYI